MMRSARDRSVAALTNTANDLVHRAVSELPASTQALVHRAVSEASASVQLKFEPSRQRVTIDLIFTSGATATLFEHEPEPEIEDDEPVGPDGYGGSSLDRLR